MAGWISAACCLRWGLQGQNYSANGASRAGGGDVRLDTDHCGTDVVIVKNGRRICGTGGALANAPIVQTKAYFEAKIQSTGLWGVGVASRDTNLDKVPMGRDQNSWILRDDGKIIHNDKQIGTFPETPQEGDVIAFISGWGLYVDNDQIFDAFFALRCQGLTYDHYELNFYLNGKPMNAPVTGIRGTIYPLVYVDDDATVDLQFSTFYHAPPSGFERIMVEKTLL